MTKSYLQVFIWPGSSGSLWHRRGISLWETIVQLWNAPFCTWLIYPPKLGFVEVEIYWDYMVWFRIHHCDIVALPLIQRVSVSLYLHELKTLLISSLIFIQEKEIFGFKDLLRVQSAWDHLQQWFSTGRLQPKSGSRTRFQWALAWAKAIVKKKILCSYFEGDFLMQRSAFYSHSLTVFVLVLVLTVFVKEC